MDRIREAVTRAKQERDAQGAADNPPARRPSAPGGVIASPDFPTFACDPTVFSQNRIICNENDPALSAYRVLRTKTLQKMDANGWRSVAVVSPGSGAGKSVTAINLAFAIGSKDDSRSVLVDLDFYRPSIAKYLGVKSPPSLLDFFEGKRQLREVAIKAEVSNTLVLANERVSRRGAEHLTSPRADDLLRTAFNEFGARTIVFDISPLIGCDDAIAFLPKVDCVLLVAASGRTRPRDLKEAKRLLEGTNIVGTVLNMAPSTVGYAGYY